MPGFGDPGRCAVLYDAVSSLVGGGGISLSYYILTGLCLILRSVIAVVVTEVVPDVV